MLMSVHPSNSRAQDFLPLPPQAQGSISPSPHPARDPAHLSRASSSLVFTNLQRAGPISLSCSPLRGCTFLLKDYSSVYPSHLTCACDTPLPPSCFPAPPYSPLSRLSKLSASLNSPAVGEYGVEAGPSEVGVRGARAGGGLGAAPAEKREKSKGEREAEAGGQPAGFISLLY